MHVNRMIAVCLASLLFACSAVAQNKTDRERDGLLGAARSVRVEQAGFTVVNGKNIESARVRRFTDNYNAGGNKSERIVYKDDGLILEKLSYLFNEKGMSIGYEEYTSVIPNGLTIPRKHNYKLDEKGNKIEYTVYDSDGTQASRFTYKYNDKGEKIEEDFYYHTGQLGSKTVYVYDDKGREIGQTNYLADNSINYRLVSFYDTKGSKAKMVQYAGTILKYEFIYAYDNKGRITELGTVEHNVVPNQRSSHAPIPGKVVYTYNDEDETREITTYDNNGSPKNRVVTSSDNKGNEIMRASYNLVDSTVYL
jgi:hypothetical protein